MSKKEGLVFIRNDSLTTSIAWYPLFDDAERHSVLIKSAVIKLAVVKRTGDFPMNEDDYLSMNLRVCSNLFNEHEDAKNNIDYILGAHIEENGEWKNNEFICLNVTDIYQEFLKSDDSIYQAYNGAFILSIDMQSSNSISFKEPSHIYVDYILDNSFTTDNAYQETDAKRAGNGKINLASGNLKFLHEDVESGGDVLPVSISHVYNTLSANLTNDKVIIIDTFKYIEVKTPDYNCGKGWKLNVQQYLVQEKFSIGLHNDETAKKFTYIDSDSNQQIFEEKYYYETNASKHYIKANQIDIDTEQKLRITVDGVKYDVEKEVSTTSNLKLISAPEEFKGLKYIETDVEEIANLKSQLTDIRSALTQYKNALADNEKASTSLTSSKSISDLQFDIQDDSLSSELTDIDLQESIIPLQWNYNIYSKDYRNFVDGKAGDAFDDKVSEQVAKNKKRLANQTQDNIDKLNSERLWGILPKEDKIFSDDEIPNITKGLIYERRNLYSDNIALLEKNKAFSKTQFTQQQEQLERDKIILQDNIAQYEILEIKAQRQLAALVKQVPVHYITDESGAMMGFGITDKENLFRLIVVADKWENAIFIRYNDKNQIENIIDADENVITFEYEENAAEAGKLISITDDRSRTTKFVYNNGGYLTKIIYPSGEFSAYSYDTNGFLLSAVEPSGYGVSYTYEYGQTVGVTEISKTESINDNSAVKYIGTDKDIKINGEFYRKNNWLNIDYHDYKSTSVTDKYNKCLTYNFDKMGRPLTVYENGGLTNAVNALSYEYSDDKTAYKTSALPNSEDFLYGGILPDSEDNSDCGVFISNDNGIKYEYVRKQAVENYLGGSLDCNNIIAGDEPMLAAYEVETADEGTNNYFEIGSIDKVINTECLLWRSLTEDKLANIKNSGIKDLVLSGWAKADSVYVNRRSTDCCGKCDPEENYSETEQIFIDNADINQKNRRFELRAEIEYANHTDTQYASFDWMQKEWQYCAFPVSISENPYDVLTGIKVIFDYSYNSGKAELFGMSLREGKWEYTEYNDDKQITYSENSVSQYITEYQYDRKKRLVKSTVIDKQNYFLKSIGQKYTDYPTNYEYNYAGAPVRTVDYNGIVTENEYNDKGIVIKTVKYHKDEPSNKQYQESVTDEKGKVSGEVNELGEKLCDYEYVKDTGMLSSVKSADGGITSYGYNHNDDTLLGVTAAADGETNANIYGYNLGLLTKLCHNGTDIDYSYDGFGRLTGINLAGAEYLSCEYKNVTENKLQSDGTYINVLCGESVTTTLGNREVYESITDNKGNLTQTKYNGVTLTENLYDAWGRHNAMRDYSYGEKSQCGTTYDNYGNVIKKEYTGYGKDFALNAVYDEFGTQTESGFKLGEEAERKTFMSYEQAYEGKLNTITLTNGIKQSLEYDKLGRITGISSKGGINSGIDISLSKDIHYLNSGDHASNLVASEWFGKNGVVKDSLKYTYDEKGNIASIKENSSIIARYTYDSLSRIIREDNKKLGKTTVLVYDAGGNILTKTEYGYTFAATETLENGEEILYGYRTSGWKDQLLSYNGVACDCYDALGNPWLYRGKSLSWSHGRRLDSIQGITYKYNAGGVRISKTVDGINTRFYADGTTLLAQETDGTKLYFNYGADGINGFTYSGVGEYIYKKNIQGDILAVLSADGSEIVRYVYDAWGNHKTYVLDNGQYLDTSLGHNYTANGLNNKIISELNPYRYRSYYYDSESGLYYLNSRYYDSEVGRFINADDVSYAEPETINGINFYAYCLNNPIGLIDKDGNKPNWKKIFGWIVTGIILIGLAVATVLTFGAAAPITGAAATLVIGATVGAYVGFGASVISQGGFANADPWQVLLDTTVGAGTGALMAAPVLNAIGTGVLIGGLNSIQSIGTDLIAGEKINWGKAIGIGTVIGLISGVGKGFFLKYYNFAKANPAHSGIMGGLAEGVAIAMSKFVKAITAGLRSGAKGLFNYLWN